MSISFEGKGPFHLPDVTSAKAYPAADQVQIGLRFLVPSVGPGTTALWTLTSVEVARDLAAQLLAAANDIARRESRRSV